MSKAVWEIEHSVEASVSLQVAWTFWTNVANWSDPSAEFEINGPFQAGSRGVTRVPGHAPIGWLVREVSPPSGATIEMALEGATLSFKWRLTELAADQTRLTQRIVLSGENAPAFLSQVEGFTANLAGGMSRLAVAMESWTEPGRS